MENEVLEMSKKERDRLYILNKVKDGLLSQIHAAKLLKVSDRQIRNLLKQLNRDGDKGILSKKRGKKSNRSISEKIKQQTLNHLNEKLEGFGPTIAQEKLESLYGINLSRETIRQWMIQAGIHIPRKKKKKTHKTRCRRACFGELIQTDGSHHHWFGKDLPMATLIVMIDDATGIITSMHFAESESLQAYFQALEQHLCWYGRPRAFYTDKAAVFQPRVGDNETQFGRALRELEIELILAHSPQAKGRVERANRTLQDRLLKELRLKGIDNIQDANNYLEEYRKEHNKKFSKVPMSNIDAHRPMKEYDLDFVLTTHKNRVLTSICTFQYANRCYEVQGLAKNRVNKGRKVKIIEKQNSDFSVFVDGIQRKVKEVEDYPVKASARDRKQLQFWKPRNWKQKKDHPWKRWNPKYFNRVV